jgi:hypothetical protein
VIAADREYWSDQRRSPRRYGYRCDAKAATHESENARPRHACSSSQLVASQVAPLPAEQKNAEPRRRGSADSSAQAANFAQSLAGARRDKHAPGPRVGDLRTGHDVSAGIGFIVKRIVAGESSSPDRSALDGSVALAPWQHALARAEVRVGLNFRAVKGPDSVRRRQDAASRGPSVPQVGPRARLLSMTSEGDGVIAPRGRRLRWPSQPYPLPRRRLRHRSLPRRPWPR